MRRRVLVAVPVVVFCVWAAYVATIAYTVVAGEKATAAVESCSSGGTSNTGRAGPGTCRGTWRTEGGETGRGEIYNLNTREAAGETVQVRIGPLGPYSPERTTIWITPAVSGLFVLLPLAVYVAVLRRRLLPRRNLAESLLAAPGGLLVADGAVRRPDGSPHVLVERLPDPPPGRRRLDLPGRTDRHDELPGPGRTVYESVRDADGGPLMFLEHRSDRKLNPETVLLDPSGAPVMLLRRVGENEYRLLDPSGDARGSARRPDGARIPALEVRDAAGKAVATTVEHGREWALRIEADAPPPLRDAALVLALVQNRAIY
ncbi:hypothetical protein ACFHW2_07865 [Actinomadura sp. LOL_016]|uniref:hypothetical protein n=1 Tax=unclassified Actinomadura TaxID=2626254 RepID=UPI003A7FECF9